MSANPSSSSPSSSPASSSSSPSSASSVSAASAVPPPSPLPAVAPSPAPAPPVAAADLRTQRLLLRIWTGEELAAVVGGLRSARWAADFPAEGDVVIAGFLRERPEALGTYGHRTIVERGTGLVVGSIGLFWPPSDGHLEIGYGIVPSRRGRGYATEAARALALHGLSAPGVHTVGARVEPDNPASVRVLEKAGMRRLAAADGLLTYGMSAPGTEAAPAGSGTGGH